MREEEKNTPDYWFENKKWTKFLLALPPGKTRVYTVSNMGEFMSIRTTASILTNNPNCDIAFSLSMDYEKNTFSITASRKRNDKAN